MMNIMIALGLVPAFCLAASAEPFKRFIFVNGGYAPSVNFQAHEEDMIVFDRMLFGERTVMLNAGGGPEMKVVQIEANGRISRDSSGAAVTVPSHFSGQKEANLFNLRTEFDAAAKSGASGIAIVYGDHGGVRGVSLWDNNAISAEELRGLYSRIPENIPIRAVHLHCFAGVALVDPKRKVPSSFAELTSFLKSHYPKNRCAWAMSSEDEVGRYLNWTNRWPVNYWNALFLKNSKPSLNDLHARIEQDATVNSTPMRTTDYLVRDLSSAICAGISRPTTGSASGACSSCIEGSGEKPKELQGVFDVLKKDLCGGEAAKGLAQATEDVRMVHQMESEYETLKYEFADDYIYEKDIEVYLERKAAVRMLDELYARHAAAGTTPSAEEVKKIQGEDWIGRFDRLRGAVLNDSHPDLQKFLKGIDQKWLDSRVKDYPALSKHLSKLGPLRGPGLSTVAAALTKARDARQLERKKTAILAKARQRKLVEAWLNMASVPEIREAYENIRDCETAPLN